MKRWLTEDAVDHLLFRLAAVAVTLSFVVVKMYSTTSQLFPGH